MRDYRFDFANGITDLVETFAVRCGYVRYYELISGGGVDQRIRVESMGGGWSVVLRPGQGFRLPAEETAGVVITNISGSAMAGMLKLGPRDWQFEDQRLLGEVSVVDGGLSRSRANSAYAGGVAMTSTVLTNMAGLQLWNNASAGGPLLVVSNLSVFSGFSGAVQYALRLDNTAANNPQAVRSKMAGGANSAIAQLRSTESNIWGTPTSTWLTTPQVGAKDSFRATEPIVIPPQFGLMVTDNVTTAIHTTWANFEHYEVTQ
jgi:hypothetical protein